MKRLFKPFLALAYWQGTTVSAARSLHAEAAKQGRPVHVVTLTTEMLLHATEHPAVQTAIESGDFFVADTVSLTVWLKLHGAGASRVTGIDLAEMLIKTAGNPRVALIGDADAAVREKAAQTITGFGGAVTISAAGPHITDYEHFDDAGLIAVLQTKKPDIIFVAFGHGKQEWWISKIKKLLNFPTIIIGVGGTVDVWGGQMIRAPRLMRAIGLEWLWRLILQPRRIKRILMATVVFPYRAIRESLL